MTIRPAGVTNDKSDAAPSAVADAVRGNWVDNRAPESWRPYLRLMRADRPIGSWLLFWPCAWSVGLAAVAHRGDGLSLTTLWHLFLFFIGAVAMRGAGCVYNDIVDRDYDAKVARTRSRPIPAGQVTVNQAILFMAALGLTGLIVLLQFNWFTIALGLASLGVVAIYPFMKRITHWPQFVLGLAFGWGALMGWAAGTGGLDWPPIILYAGTIAWIIGYDTIYAHQDKEDDALAGLKSTALKFSDKTAKMLLLFYGLALMLILIAGVIAGAGLIFLGLMTLAALQLGWQIWTLDVNDGDNCLRRFRSNHGFGALVFCALVLDRVM